MFLTIGGRKYKLLKPLEFLSAAHCLLHYCYRPKDLLLKEAAIRLLGCAAEHLYTYNNHGFYAAHVYGNGNIIYECVQHAEAVSTDRQLTFLSLKRKEDQRMIGGVMWSRHEIEEEIKKASVT